MIERALQYRLALIALLVGMMLLGLGARLAFLHLSPHERWEDRVARMRRAERVLPAERGRIMDRNGQILAMDLAVKDISADPLLLQDHGNLDNLSRQLARLLQLEPAFILGRITREGRRFEYLKRNVDTEVADRVKRLQVRGLIFEDTMVRHYIHGPLMAHVVGFSNLEGVGSAGVEQGFNGHLTGIPGLLVSERDGRRRELYGRRSIDIEPRRGSDIRLTLDQTLQHLVESALDSGLEEYGGEGAWAIMMRVDTGEILAMASRPTYDLNGYRYSSTEERRNRAISFNYEPGSTFKAPIIAAAFNEGLIAPGQVIDCENGLWHYGGRPLRDYSPNDMLTIADILKKSSNIGTAKIALMMDEAKVEAYIRAFGIGASTGIDLPGEETGIFRPRRDWSALSVTRLAMGHEMAVTALQLLNAINTIANDGYRMRPYVVQQVVDPEGKVLHRGAPEVLARPIRPEVATLMRRLMARVTEPDGTGRRAAVPGYRVCGKTGTAQKPIPGGYSDTENIASFVGFLPSDDPVFSLVVVVDAPVEPRTGGGVAAPLFRRIAEPAARYLDIPLEVSDRAG
jgi:cell division protein FtsI (penicillin-binding protein 3)